MPPPTLLSLARGPNKPEEHQEQHIPENQQPDSYQKPAVLQQKDSEV